MRFRGSDLNTFGVIKRRADNTRCKYHRSNCCLHAIITRTVFHPGTPCLHTNTIANFKRPCNERVISICSFACSYSEKFCCPIFVGESTRDVFTGATAHLRVCRRDICLVLRPGSESKNKQEFYPSWDENHRIAVSIDMIHHILCSTIHTDPHFWEQLTEVISIA